MNRVDVAILVLLALFTLRGLWRGFFRESLGFIGLVVGLLAALQWADAGATLVVGRVALSAGASEAVAFIGIFVLVHTTATLLGFLLDRVAHVILFGPVNRLAGAVFGFAKANAVLAFVLLFLRLFSPWSELEREITASRIGQSLTQAANMVVRAGWHGSGHEARPGQA